jgi:hypothetical protein
MDVVAIDDDVAEINAHAKYDRLVFGLPFIASHHPALHRDCTGDRLHDAWEFDEDAIAGRFDDPAFVFGDFRIDQFTTVAPKPGKDTSFVLSHEAAVTDDIGGKNGREPAFDPLSAQCDLPGTGCSIVWSSSD